MRGSNRTAASAAATREKIGLRRFSFKIEQWRALQEHAAFVFAAFQLVIVEFPFSALLSGTFPRIIFFFFLGGRVLRAGRVNRAAFEL